MSSKITRSQKSPLTIASKNSYESLQRLVKKMYGLTRPAISQKTPRMRYAGSLPGKCKPPRFLHTRTRKCIKKAGPTHLRMLKKNKCPASKVINPLTGRCIKRNTPLHKALVHNLFLSSSS